MATCPQYEFPATNISFPDFTHVLACSLSRRGGCQNQKRPRFPLLVPPSPSPQFPSVVGAVIKCSLGPSLAPRTSLARIATRTNVREGEGGREGTEGRRPPSLARMISTSEASTKAAASAAHHYHHLSHQGFFQVGIFIWDWFVMGS